MDDSKLRELIDACRPHGEDSAAPAMRELADELLANPGWKQPYDRSRRLDAAVADAMQTGFVPKGLAECLLANAREGVGRGMEDGEIATDNCAAGDNAANDNAVSAEERFQMETLVSANAMEPAGNIVLARQEVLVGRRRWFGMAIQFVSTAAVLVLIVAGVAWYRSPSPITREGLSGQVLGWVTAVSEDWRPLESAPVKAYSPGGVLAVVPRGWQRLATLHDRQAVVYDLTRKQGRAMLFVVQTKMDSSFSSTPSRLPSTGGWGICAWKEGENLYVLVVDEGRLRFEQFLRPSRTVAQSNSSTVLFL